MWLARGTLIRLVVTAGLVTVVLGSLVWTVAAQRGIGRLGRGTGLLNQAWIYDGAFVFCRLAFDQSGGGDGGGWSVDYPRADLNFPFRLGELTETPVSHDERGEPNHVVVTLSDPHLFECPFLMMTEPGGAYFSDTEAAQLRTYLDKGGFLWADDFWGEYAWYAWSAQLRKALPEAEFPIVDLPMDHPIFRLRYGITSIPQIPSINFWYGSGFQTSERADSTVPHVRGIMNARGDVMVLMTHNTDFGDAFEREGEDKQYFERFASLGYGFGINVFLYAMTH